MFDRVRSRLCGAFLAGALVAGSAAGAATIDLRIQEFGDLAGARNALAAFQAGQDGSGATTHRVTSSRTETFEGFDAWNYGGTGTQNPMTAVGRFTSRGGIGTAGATIHGGTALEMRRDNPMISSRQNSTVDGANWLDSNDTLGMNWEAGGLPQFNALSFLLTDVADKGAVFSIGVGDTLFSQVLGGEGRLADGTIHLVTILLPDAVNSLAMALRNNRLNDGFGIDDVTIANVAPIPLPPAAALLITGIAAMTALRRRRGARTAA